MTPREIRALIDARVEAALSSQHPLSSHSTSTRGTLRTASLERTARTVEGLHDEVEGLRESLDARLREAAREQQRAMGDMRATLERDHARDVAALRDEVAGRAMASAARRSS